MKALAKVAPSANEGPLTTAIQESVFSRGAAAELNKSACRTHPKNLSIRVFNMMNKNCRNPVKGSKASLFTLKRKNIQLEVPLPKKVKMDSEGDRCE